MKALTVHQPWASLLALGIKHWETRSWRPPADVTRLAVHASRRPPLAGWEEMLRHYPEGVGSAMRPLMEWLTRRGEVAALPTGAVLAICNLLRVSPTCGVGPSPHASRLGDWSRGRWAWNLQVVHVFNPPIPARGQQGLWEWEPPEGRYP